MSRTHRWAPLLLVLAAVLTASADRPQPRNGRVSELGHMLAPRSGHTATLLNDGRVLIAGGMVQNREFLDSAELFDPATHTFTPTGKMMMRRVGQIAALLHDGRVLVAGGWVHGTTAEAEVYDLRTGHFTQIAGMQSARAGATATTLDDGRVLITGGSRDDDRVGLNSAELFDPKTMRFVPVGEMHSGRTEHTATLLGDGTVLVTGGMDDRRVVATAEVFDPKTNRFTVVGAMRQGRYKHTAQRLADGRVLVAGGSDDRDWKGTLAEAEVYDPAKRSFTPAPSMAEKRFKLDHQAAALPDGKVLIAGGNETAEVFDGKEFQPLNSGTGTPQWFMTETALKNGEVLLTCQIFCTSRCVSVAPLS
jgi:hypothetical protein